MKKHLLIAATMLMCAVSMAFAQTETKVLSPEERNQKKAESMAAKLLLSDADAAKFIPVYQSFLKANRAILEKYKPEKPADQTEPKKMKTDKEIEASLRSQLAKSQEILDLRKVYLDKYLKIMSPRQVRELYKLEQEQQRKKWRNQPASRGPQATAPRQGRPRE